MKSKLFFLSAVLFFISPAVRAQQALDFSIVEKVQALMKHPACVEQANLFTSVPRRVTSISRTNLNSEMTKYLIQGVDADQNESELVIVLGMPELDAHGRPKASIKCTAYLGQ